MQVLSESTNVPGSARDIVEENHRRGCRTSAVREETSIKILAPHVEDFACAFQERIQRRQPEARFLRRIAIDSQLEDVGLKFVAQVSVLKDTGAILPPRRPMG